MSSSSPGAAAEPTERALANFSAAELNEVFEKLQTEIITTLFISYGAAEQPRPSAPAEQPRPSAPIAEISLKDKLKELYEIYKDEESKQLIFNGYTLYCHKDEIAIAIEGQEPIYVSDASDDQLSKVIEDLQDYYEPKRRFDPTKVGGRNTLAVGQDELDSFRGLRSSDRSTVDDPVKFIQSFMIDKEAFSLTHNGVEYNISNLGNEEILVGFQDAFLQDHLITLDDFISSEPEVTKELVREIKQNTSYVDINGASEPEGQSRF